MSTAARSLIDGLSRVPGVSRVRRHLADVVRHRHLATAVGLVAASAQEPGAMVAVLGPLPERSVAALRRAAPDARVVVLADGAAERRARSAATGPFDAIIDATPRSERLRNFEECFFHLRPRGSYVVPGGAKELADTAHGLGLRFAEAATAPDRPFRTTRDRDPATLHLMVLKQHVTARAAGKDLVISHDLDDVWVKTRDRQYNQLLAATGGRHRVLKVLPATEPPPLPPGEEGPEQRRPPMQRPIRAAELSLREYFDVEVRRTQIVLDGRVLLPDTYRHNQWPRMSHRNLHDVARGFAVARAASRPAQELSGTWLHLDNEYRGHFGHLLTETVSRFWSWEEAQRLAPDVGVLVGATPQRPELLPYELEVFEAAGIPADRIRLVRRPVRVERLISGSPMFSHPQFVDPRIVPTWDRVGDGLARSASDREWPQRLFIGRKVAKRSCANSEEVEAIFADHGFEVVFPEDHRLGDQVQMFRRAEVIGGYMGSGLFQTMFVREPKHVIQVGPSSYTPRNEYLIAAVRGHRLDSVVARAEGRSLKAGYTFDLDREGVFLRRLLEEHVPVR